MAFVKRRNTFGLSYVAPKLSVRDDAPMRYRISLGLLPFIIRISILLHASEIRMHQDYLRVTHSHISQI